MTERSSNSCHAQFPSLGFRECARHTVSALAHEQFPVVYQFSCHQIRQLALRGLTTIPVRRTGVSCQPQRTCMRSRSCPGHTGPCCPTGVHLARLARWQPEHKATSSRPTQSCTAALAASVKNTALATQRECAERRHGAAAWPRRLSS